jgi:hypothetical protein
MLLPMHACSMPLSYVSSPVFGRIHSTPTRSDQLLIFCWKFEDSKLDKILNQTVVISWITALVT